MSDLPTLTGAKAKTLEPNTDYEGTITDVDVRETDRWGDYLDVEVTPEGPDATLNPSYAMPDDGNLTPGHDLGKLVERITGEPIEVGQGYDVGDIVQTGTRVSIRTGPESEEGYVNAVKDSLRPAGQDYEGEAQQTSIPSDEGETSESGVSETLMQAYRSVELTTPVKENALIGAMVQNGHQEAVAELNDALQSGAIEQDDDGTIHEIPGE